MKAINLLFIVLVLAQITAIAQTPQQFAIVGGPSIGIMKQKLYQNPIVNPVDSTVIVERDDNWRANGSLGFAWSPWPYIDGQGKPIGDYGPSFAVFGNLVNLAGISKDGGGLDFGTGIGYKFRAVYVFVAAEWFKVRQPKQYVIDQFQGEKFYKGSAIQMDISPTDNNLFRDKGVTALSLKMIFPLVNLTDIVKSTR
jgi:hypothetical protein